MRERRMRAVKYLIVALILWAPGPAVRADEVDVIQCGTYLIHVGDQEYDVLRKCGEPTYREGDRWIYDKGPAEFPRVIQMDGGEVTYMEVLEK